MDDFEFLPPRGRASEPDTRAPRASYTPPVSGGGSDYGSIVRAYSGHIIIVLLVVVLLLVLVYFFSKDTPKEQRSPPGVSRQPAQPRAQQQQSRQQQPPEHLVIPVFVSQQQSREHKSDTENRVEEIIEPSPAKEQKKTALTPHEQVASQITPEEIAQILSL